VILASATLAALAVGATLREGSGTGSMVLDETRARLRLPLDGRPVLVVAGDPSCGACRRAWEDLAEPVAWDSRGVHVALREDGELSAAGMRFPPGPIPIYALLDGEGRLLATTRGYLPPALLERWVRAAFADGF
jgi:hypothetical protein